MNKTVVFLMGKSGCGKSTLERSLVELFPSLYKKVISATTRPLRPGEQHGVDYYFYDDEGFDTLDLVQYTEFGNNRYGSMVSEYTTEHRHPILCVVPISARMFTETIHRRFPDFKTCNIYFDISNERLIQNMRKRGDTEEMIKKRIAVDDLDEQFRQSGLTADIVIRDNDLDKRLPFKVASLMRNRYE